jgi:serine/threonine-protein kinase RsbW
MEGTPDRCSFDPAGLIQRFDLTIAGDIKSLEPAVVGIMAIVADMRCAEGKEFAIETAIREALANAIRHGCKGDPSRSVRISVSCNPSEGMIIVVRDPGEGFDPAKIPSPIIGDRLYAEHGRGIYMINQLMDEVRFRAHGTEIWMRKA